MPNAEVSIGGVRPEKAIEFLVSKLRIPTKRWDDQLGEFHAKAFTIAGAIKADILRELHEAITESLKNGEGISAFRKRFDQIVKKHGWSYKGKRGWRTRVIYGNNLNSAHMAGRWYKMQETKSRRPYLQYLTAGDQRVRPEHKQWHRISLHIDDPFWDTHYPPNGHLCRCATRTLSERDLQRSGRTLSKSPKIHRTKRANTLTGEYYGEVPHGIDTGFDHNVGKAWLGSDIAFGEKIAQLPADIKSVVYQANPSYHKTLTKSWQNWLKQVEKRDKPAGYAHSVGLLPQELELPLAAKGKTPKNALMVIQDHQINHLKGTHKKADKTGKAKAVPDNWLEELPLLIQDYQAILYDSSKENLLIVTKEQMDGKRGRLVMEVNYKRKGQIYNPIISAGLRLLSNLKGDKSLEVLLGEL